MSSLSKDDGSSHVGIIHPSGDYSRKHGTSMATPHVAGAVALLLAEDPALDSEQIKSLLQSNAKQDSFTGDSCSNTWVCGKLSLEALAPTPIMTVSKSANVSNVMAGDEVTFTVSTQNIGSSRALGVSIIDNLPPSLNFASADGCAYDTDNHRVTCDLGDVEVGEGTSRDIIVSPWQLGTVSNEASVFAGSDLWQGEPDSQVELGLLSKLLSNCALEQVMQSRLLKRMPVLWLLRLVGDRGLEPLTPCV
jgi:uncharacterized repeat protein (TIGR01451 family)